jgi:hypothetical protein
MWAVRGDLRAPETGGEQPHDGDRQAVQAVEESERGWLKRRLFQRWPEPARALPRLLLVRHNPTAFDPTATAQAGRDRRATITCPPRAMPLNL